MLTVGDIGYPMSSSQPWYHIHLGNIIQTEQVVATHSIESLTFFDMKRCCHEHWNIVPVDMVGKALTALQAEVVSLNTTTALWRPQGVTETIGPSTDSLWIPDLRSSAGCMFFFAHLEMEQMGGKQIRIFIATSLPVHTYTSRGQWIASPEKQCSPGGVL